MNNQFDKINKLLTQRKYSEAISLLSNLIENNSEDKIKLLKRRAQIFSEIGYLDQAMNDLRYLIQLNPHDEQIWISLGEVYKDLSQYSRAIEIFQRVIEINPNNIVAWVNIADLYSRLNDYKRAIELYQHVLMMSPDNIVANMGLGWVYHQLMDYDRARKIYQKILMRNPNNIIAFIGLGNLYRQQKNYGKAIDVFQRAVRTNPNDALAWLELGNLYSQKKDYGRAIDFFQRSILINPNNTVAFLEMGNLFFQQKNYDNAITSYIKALEIDPNNAKALNNLGRAYVHTGKSEEGTELIRDGEHINHEFSYETKGILKVYFSSSAPITTIIEFLEAIKLFYNLILLLERPEIIDCQLLGKSLDSYLKINRQLYLNSVRISSPGFWEFLGSLNPLEQIREYLKDKHERKKDNEYKKDIEKTKGYLEIQQQINKVILERVQLLKELGYDEKEIRENFDKLVKPMEKLTELESGYLISNVSIIKNDDSIPGNLDRLNRTL